MDLLINGTNDGTASPDKTTQHSSPLKPAPQTWSAQAVPFVPKPRDKILPPVQTDVKSAPYLRQSWQLPNPDCTDCEDFKELNYDDISPVTLVADNQQYGCEDYEQDDEEFYDTNHDDRSLVLKGISPFTTLADVLAEIRGGAVLNVYLRPQERTAHVAFVEPIAAEKFLIHSRRTDIYVRGKRVCASQWTQKFY